MAKGMSKYPGARISVSKILIRLAILFVILAILLILYVALTAKTANKLMSIQRSELTDIPSNILPTYSPTSFSSFDGQTTLSGWFFQTDDPISTIIIVHDAGSNRMPFGVDTVDLIEDMLSAGYNVFLFDQRNSGESEDGICGYGYLEWQDVIGAIDQVRKISITTNVILYGIGVGCSSSLLALDKLPEPGEYDDSYSDDILALNFDRSYVIGIILDSPAKHSDDYITPLVKKASKFGFITKYFVPYAIRISAGESENVNFTAEISRLAVPVCIMYGENDTFIGSDVISQIVDERMHLHENTTSAYVFPDAEYTKAYETDPETYRYDIIEFLSMHFQ